MTPSPEARLAAFVAKFSPEMARRIRAARKAMRQRLPHAVELVYDNYNFFVIGYGPSERPSEAIFSLAANAKGLTLFFLQGAGLPDPEKLLRGSGNVVRSLRLEDESTLARPEVRALMRTALERARTPMDPKGAPRLVIRSVSAKQRPRRPPEDGAGRKARARKPKAAASTRTRRKA